MKKQFYKEVSLGISLLLMGFIISNTVLKGDIYNLGGTIFFKEISKDTPRESATAGSNEALVYKYYEKTIEKYPSLKEKKDKVLFVFSGLRSVLQILKNTFRLFFQLPIYLIIILFLIQKNLIYQIKQMKFFMIFTASFILLSMAIPTILDFSGVDIYFFWYSQVLIMFLLMLLVSKSINKFDPLISRRNFFILTILILLLFPLLLSYESRSKEILGLYSPTYFTYIVIYSTMLINIAIITINYNKLILRGTKLLVTINVLFIFVFGGYSFVELCNDWVNIGFWKGPTSVRKIWDPRATIDKGEWDAMIWLQQNVEKKKVFFTDRRYMSHPRDLNRNDPRFYYYSSLSGLYAYAEGEYRYRDYAEYRWALVNQFLFSNNIEEKKKALYEIDAQYFIQSLRFNDNDYSTINELELIFENNSIKIYKINSPGDVQL